MSGAVLIAATSGGLSVSLSPLLVVGFGTGTVTTNQAITAAISGGTAPLTYLWTSFDPDIFPVTANQPYSFFRRNDVQPGENYGATVKFTVTDASGQTASGEASVNISGL